MLKHSMQRFGVPRSRAAMGFVLAAALVLATAGCGTAGSDEGGGDGGSSGDPIVLGIQTHETGAISALAPDKVAGIEAGVELATEGTNEVDGRPIEFTVVDDGSDPGAAPQAARQQLQQDDPAIVFGFDSSSSATATAPIMADAGIPTIYTIAATNDLTGFSEWVFRTSRDATQEAQMGSEVAHIKKGETFQILAPEYDYGESAATAWEEKLEEEGGVKAGNTLFAPLEGKDYTAVVERIRKDDPEKLIVITFASASGPLLWQTIHDAGIADSSEIITLLPQKAAREAMGPIATQIKYYAIYDRNLPEGTLNKEFIKAFEEHSGGKGPDIYAGDSGVGGELAVEALKKTGGDTDPEAIREALTGLKGEGLKGAYEVRPEDHTFLQSFYEARVNPEFEAELVQAFPMQDSVTEVLHPIGG